MCGLVPVVGCTLRDDMDERPTRCGTHCTYVHTFMHSFDAENGSADDSLDSGVACDRELASAIAAIRQPHKRTTNAGCCEPTITTLAAHGGNDHAPYLTVLAAV